MGVGGGAGLGGVRGAAVVVVEAGEEETAAPVGDGVRGVGVAVAGIAVAAGRAVRGGAGWCRAERQVEGCASGR